MNPSLIISALRGPFDFQIVAHEKIVSYLGQNPKTRIIFLSSSNVFDAYSKYPCYENDTRLSNSIYGRFKIRIESQIQKLPKHQSAIIRLPMVFGLKSNRIKKLRQLNVIGESIELFPNLIINVSSSNNLTKQIHYLSLIHI